MFIRWIGHASFQIELKDGLRIRTDPYDASIGLPISKLAADIVTVSHEHFDHNATHLVAGNPSVLRGDVDETIGSARFRSITTFHDDAKGAKRGLNTVFIIDAEGITVVHLGDLGHELQKQQLAELDSADVLMIPVGGTYTLDARTATKVAEAITARATIPMHYKTPALTIPLSPVEPFLRGKRDIRTLDELIVTCETPATHPEIVVLSARP